MNTRRVFSALLCACAVLASRASRADVAVPPLFADHMVLQRDMPHRFFGTADPGETVTVAFPDTAAPKTVTAGDDGRWLIAIDPVAAPGPHVLAIRGTANRLEIRDVLIGEVWLCSGQSNMGFTVNRARNAEAEMAAADFPRIRLFKVTNRVSMEPLEDVSGSWSVCTPETVGAYTAVGFFFGRDLHRELDCPVGLINSSWGGTPAEAWTPRPILEGQADFEPILTRFAEAIEAYPEAALKHEERVARWREQVAAAREAGTPPPRRPSPPLNENHSHAPAGLYNAMIHPLRHFPVRGAVWYQGESNAGRAYQYRTLFPTMIGAWRDAWKQDRFPFYFVQLANFRKPPETPNDPSTWAELREAQLLTMRTVPDTGMACTIDIGEADDIHPRNKQDVGARLARWALARDYGRAGAVSGPLFAGMDRQGTEIRLSFEHTDGGLKSSAPELKGFAVAGEDRVFVAATARIEGTHVIVGAADVPNPVAVRYGWADNPDCTLVNGEGLPASPFRTDEFPGITADKR